MGFNKSLNPFLDNVFEEVPDRKSTDDNSTRYDMIQRASEGQFKIDYLDGTQTFKGTVLKVYQNGDGGQGWLAQQIDSVRSLVGFPNGVFVRARVSIPELHSHIPVPCELNTSDKKNLAIIEMHPLFVSKATIDEPIKPGDTVEVSFTKGPKYGLQAGGILHRLYAEGVGGEQSDLCQNLTGIFDGRARQVRQLENSFPEQSPEGNPYSIPPDQVETDAQRRARAFSENPEAAAEIQNVFVYGPTAAPALVNSEFGPRCPPTTQGGRRGSADHPGIDLEVPAGTAIRAPFRGVISTAAARGNYGNIITVDYKDASDVVQYRVLYAHLDAFAVELGDEVAPGDHLGDSGATGNVSGPHLHIEVRVRSGTSLKPQNPRDYFPVGSFTNPQGTNPTCEELGRTPS